MKQRRYLASVLAAAGCCLFLARAKAEPLALPKPTLRYFSLLAGIPGRPAILANMAVALNPVDTPLKNVLAADAGTRSDAARAEWVTARVCQLLGAANGAAAEPFFAETPSATELWRKQFATPHSLLARLVANDAGQSRIPWEIRAGPLACVGWLLPTPKRKSGPHHATPRGGANPWEVGGAVFSFNLRLRRGRFRVLGYQNIPLGDPFAAVCWGITSGGVSLPLRGNVSLAGYTRVAYRATTRGCLLAKHGQKADFSLFFLLRPVPKALLSEVREFRKGNWPPKRAIAPTGRAKGAAGKPKAAPFDLATTYFLKRARGLKPVWFIAGRSAYYALFSGEYLGKHRLWLMKLRRSADGFRRYGFTQGPLKHACPDGLLGSDSAVTPTDAFLARTFLKAHAKKKQAAIIPTQLQAAMILAQEQEKLAAAVARPPAKRLVVPGLARVSPRNVVWRIGSPGTPRMVVVTIPKSHPFRIMAVKTGDTFLRAKLMVIKPQRRYAIVLWPKSTSGIAGWTVMAKTAFLRDGKPAWLKISVEVFPPPMHPKR